MHMFALADVSAFNFRSTDCFKSSDNTMLSYKKNINFETKDVKSFPSQPVLGMAQI